MFYSTRMTHGDERAIAAELRERYPDIEGQYPDPAAPSFPGWLSSVTSTLRSAQGFLRLEQVSVTRKYLMGHLRNI